VVKASDFNGAKQWEMVKEHNEVVQLDFLSLCLEKWCMESLLLCSGPLDDNLVKGIFEEDRRFVGFLLSQDVKAFLALERIPSPVSLKPFPVEELESTFVRFYSCFHRSQLVEPNMEPLPAETTLISPILPFMANPEKETEVLRLPDPSLE
ncbi:hypothetical protein KI387_037015, partial [Taxus chinensis]